MENDLNLTLIRDKIDKIDDEIVKNYLKRLDLVKEVAKIKGQQKREVTDTNREDKILYRLTENVDEEYRLFIRELYNSIFSTSKSYQTSILNTTSKTREKLEEILKNELKDISSRSAVACQGVNGANSGTAAKKFFPICDITYFKNFEGVFSAVESGLCEYGVLPIENSTAGSVAEVYDLMKKHNFYIVRSQKLKIEHCLATVKGGTIKDIKKVISHPQAIRQCSDYILKNKFISEEVENTAVGAKKVSEMGDKSVAVLCSVDCANIYNLQILERNVQNNTNNYTRFILIGKNLEIFSGSDKISVMTSLSHKVGSLNNVLMKFSSLGLNLTKIESRPILNTDFEFMFYFDFDGDIKNEKVLSLIAELENSSDKFVFLGSFKEI